MTADPAGSSAASFAIDAVTSADTMPSIASRSAASAPNSGCTRRRASMKPLQKRTGLTSALSQDSQEVAPGGLAAAQFDSSTLLPVPADPTTTVRRWPAPAVSRSCSTDLATRVGGSVVGRNLLKVNRAPGEAPRPVAASGVTILPRFPAHSGTAGPYRSWQPAVHIWMSRFPLLDDPGGSSWNITLSRGFTYASEILYFGTIGAPADEPWSPPDG